MWRPEVLEEALDQCLLRIQRGESVEACLSSYPEMAGELAPLLEVAARLAGSAPRVTPPTAVLADGKERFLREAMRLRAARHRRATALGLGQILQQVATLFSPLLRRGLLSTCAAVALVVAVLAGTTMMASANSLPGDPLYPVKRAAETVQMAFTFDEDTRISTQRVLDERRILETRAVLGLGKVTEVTFRGSVESVSDSLLVAAGFQVHISPLTRVIGQPVPGQVVAVTALTQPDGRLSALRIEAVEPVGGRRQPTPSATPTVVPVFLVSPTAAAIAQPSPTITRESRPTEPSPQVQRTPTVSPAPTGTPSLTATPRPSPTTVSTPAPPRDVEMRIEGAITRLGPGPWQIAGYDVHVTADTRIEEQAGKAEIGAWVRVRAIRTPDGAIVALQIVVERGPEKPGELVEFQGTIEALEPTRWVVSSQVIEIHPSTTVKGEPHVGWLAEVKARRRPDGALRATEITVRAPQEVPVEFVGVIEEIGQDRWKISGQTVRLDAQTVIEGTPAVGRRVEVQGLELPDGTVRGLRIRVKPDTTPSPTLQPTRRPVAASPTPVLRTSPTSTPPPPSEVGLATATPTPTPTLPATAAAPDTPPSPVPTSLACVLEPADVNLIETFRPCL